MNGPSTLVQLACAVMNSMNLKIPYASLMRCDQSWGSSPDIWAACQPLQPKLRMAKALMHQRQWHLEDDQAQDVI